jgi:homogentisate 1,2-dioxygenase
MNERPKTIAATAPGMAHGTPAPGAPLAGMAPGTATELGLMPGFGNDFETEALPGALPIGQNSPQRTPYGLYAEQLSGSPFTAPRGANERSWLYRIRPSVKHTASFRRIAMPHWRSAPEPVPDGFALGQYRWNPVPLPAEPLTFVTGMRTMTTAGSVTDQTGMAAHIALVTAPMENEVFINADAEMLLVAQEGRLLIATELGRMTIRPGEIAVVPRGMGAKYVPVDGAARLYVCENYGAKFTLPERGPIGANCLANPRDFKTPVAAYEDVEEPHTVVMKWCGTFNACAIPWSPLDVVAWHGNYAPYKYDLATFSPVGAILFDHPDPSIFTVLTAPSGEAGTANIDFVIFPERWLVAEHSFRPPWYHRNIMSEFMGNVFGRYDAKEEGFPPGAVSLHNQMLPHGPDADAYEKATRAELGPVKLANTLAFMFETRLPQIPTAFAAREAPLQATYADCWSGLAKRFDGTPDPR